MYFFFHLIISLVWRGGLPEDFRSAPHVYKKGVPGFNLPCVLATLGSTIAYIMLQIKCVEIDTKTSKQKCAKYINRSVIFQKGGSDPRNTSAGSANGAFFRTKLVQQLYNSTCDARRFQGFGGSDYYLFTFVKIMHKLSQHNFPKGIPLGPWLYSI